MKLLGWWLENLADVTDFRFVAGMGLAFACWGLESFLDGDPVHGTVLVVLAVILWSPAGIILGHRRRRLARREPPAAP